MKKTAIKIIAAVVLIPVAGFLLPFGAAYVYGQINLIVHKTTAEKLLDRYEAELDELVSDGDSWHKELLSLIGLKADIAYADPASFDGAFEEIWHEGEMYLFQMPYDGSFGSWRPCGLMYRTEDGDTGIYGTRALRDGWYFFWET